MKRRDILAAGSIGLIAGCIGGDDEENEEEEGYRTITIKNQYDESLNVDYAFHDVYGGDVKYENETTIEPGDENSYDSASIVNDINAVTLFINDGEEFLIFNDDGEEEDLVYEIQGPDEVTSNEYSSVTPY